MKPSIETLLILPQVMRPKVGVPIIVLLLLMSTWSFFNDDEINNWLQENSISTNSEEKNLLPIQSEERWLVLIVDFDEQPSTDAWGAEQAKNMLDDTGANYIRQLTNNQSILTVDVNQEITRASGPLLDYGQDTNGNRDMRADGLFLPMRLAEEVVKNHIDLNWSHYDLNDDGMVDRLLILHTTKGQEENPAQSGKIWSHFTHFDDPIDVSGSLKVGHYTMASLRTGSSGMGTVLHEMMHQMGALDLYPVHETVELNDWQGVGDWDIMASGNWNGGGVWPALPTASTMEKIGLNRSQSLDLTWPESAQSPCIGPTVQMMGTSDGGNSLKIEVSRGEYVWIEYRANIGFDSHLPGSGVLVTYQDTTVGDEQRNELNRDRNQPWLQVIEADGRTDLIDGANSGEASDLFTDGMQFGSEGIPIRTHDGIQVSWTATIDINITVKIHFTAPNCSPNMHINLPDFGGVFLPTDTFPISIQVEQPCNLSHQLILSDGRTFEPINMLIVDQRQIFLNFSEPSTGNSEVMMEGLLHCDEHSVSIESKILTLNRIPVESMASGTIEPFENSYLEIPIESFGDTSQSFTVHLDGPLNRIGTVSTQTTLSGDDVIRIDIQPQGLLQERMSVDGELVLQSQGGHTWTVELQYVAQSQDTSWLDEWRTPGRIVFVAGIMSAIWVFTGMTSQTQTNKNDSTNHVPSQQIQAPSKPISKDTDAWGRELDNYEL